MAIHPTAIIDPECEIHPSVEIGPYCLIRGRVRIDEGTRLEGHVVIGSEHGEVTIGKNNLFSPQAFIGGAPQDISYNNERTTLHIGDNNTFRELSTVNIGTSKGGGTVIGSDNFFMSYTHLGHDCRVDNHVVIANDTHIAGHCHIEDHVKVMGVCAFNQNVTLGKYVFLAGCSVVNKDILPFTQAQGNYAVSRATNKVGLQRSGFDDPRIKNIHRAIRILLMGANTIEESKVRIQEECEINEDIQYIFDFLQKSRRGIGR